MANDCDELCAYTRHCVAPCSMLYNRRKPPEAIEMPAGSDPLLLSVASSESMPSSGTERAWEYFCASSERRDSSCAALCERSCGCQW